MAAFLLAPFPLSQSAFQGMEGSSQGRAPLLGAACVPLTASLHSPQSASRERGRGSQGACPLAKYEAAPHGAPQRATLFRRSAASSVPCPSPDPSLAVSCAFVAMLPYALVCSDFRCGAGWCSRFVGALPSLLRTGGNRLPIPADLPRPRSHPNSALYHCQLPAISLQSLSYAATFPARSRFLVAAASAFRLYSGS